MEFLELLRPLKLLTLIGALALIQLAGWLAARWFKPRAGFILSGFIGGFISSTALTASLSRRSRDLHLNQIRLESLSYLSATLTMLVQGFLLTLLGLGTFNPLVAGVFLPPLLMTILLLGFRHRRIGATVPSNPSPSSFDWKGLLRLAVFIFAILTVSHVLQLYFGSRGIAILTFLVSLFEMHGSIIANTQLMALGNLPAREFAQLLSLSVLASYVSKVFIVMALAHPYLKKRVLLWTALILPTLLGPWLFF